MAAAAATAAGMLLTGGGMNQNTRFSDVNAHLISAVVDRLSLHGTAHGRKDPTEFPSLCLMLSRGIDFSIANNEVLNRAQELPSLLKQVCRWNKDDVWVQACIMVLMLSVKNACQSGWFSDGESEELRNLTNEIASNFGSMSNLNTEPSSHLSVISTTMSRFFPRLKMDFIYVILEAKPGYEAYVSDFQIPKNSKATPGEKVRLFVVQTDSLETSSCLISPPTVDILLNGKAVDRRNSSFMDTGAQVPTVATHLVKYGYNLLQAVGEFNGNYIIAVTLMSDVSNPDATVLQDCEKHTPAMVDEDSEIIEGPSRISLNCPISFKRINTPVKGHSCKHIQCFDFDNYVDINSRRPSWRCPHCHQHACFPDIRIDQEMVKILKEVGPKVNDVIITSNGSWKAVLETDDATKKSDNITSSNPRKDDSSQNENVNLLNMPTDIMDLTDTDDLMFDVVTPETEDIKPSSTAYQNQFTTQDTAVNPLVTNASDVNPVSNVGDEFWSRMYLSTLGSGSSNVQSSACASPLGSLTPAPNVQVESFHSNALVPHLMPQNQMSVPDPTQTHQYPYGNPTNTNEYGRSPSLPRFVTRVPTAVQALAAQTSNSVQQLSGNRANTFVQNELSTASQNPAASPLMFNPAAHANPNVPQMAAWHQYSGYQHVNRPSPNHVQHAYRATNEHQLQAQQMSNFRIPQTMIQYPSSMQSLATSPFLLQNNIGHPHNRLGDQQAHLMAASNRNAQMAVNQSRTVAPTYSAYPNAHLMGTANRTSLMSGAPRTVAPTYSTNPDGHRLPHGDLRVNTGVMTQPQPQPLTSPQSYDPSNQSWRPVGRMRGALSGQAYVNAFDQFIVRPNEQAQAARPPPNWSDPSPPV